MALKKNFTLGTKYYYAVINRVEYIKNTTDSLGLSHLISIDLLIRDEVDSTFNKLENCLSYYVPERGTKQEPRYSDQAELDPDGNEIKDKDGNSIITSVVTGYQEVPDEDYVNPFLIDNMQQEGCNIVSLAYAWIKQNIELVKDFEDC